SVGRLSRRPAVRVVTAALVATFAVSVAGARPAAEGQSRPNALPPDVVGTVGAPGGTPYFANCENGFVVGLAGRTGDVIDRIAPMCVAFDRADRWIGEPVAGDGSGGPDGAPFTTVCPRDTLVTGFTAAAGEYVYNIRLV